MRCRHSAYRARAPSALVGCSSCCCRVSKACCNRNSLKTHDPKILIDTRTSSACTGSLVAVRTCVGPMTIVCSRTRPQSPMRAPPPSTRCAKAVMHKHVVWARPRADAHGHRVRKSRLLNALLLIARSTRRCATLPRTISPPPLVERRYEVQRLGTTW